jgi:serine/threonine-protein kinase OSR1/STK39
MRNPRRELNDIRFEYKPSQDTADGISNELLATGLITNEDLLPMATNLKLLVENPPPSRVVTFRVTTGFSPADQPDEKNLVGYAQLSLTDC